METLEVHAKDFLIKWVNVPDNAFVDWQIKPLRKSISFAIYKKNSENESVEEFRERNNSSSTLNSTNSSGRLRSSSIASVNKMSELFFKTKSRSSTLSTNINNGDLKLVKNYNKLISDELVHGKLDVIKPGIYAFIFDNSFSKTTGKKILFSTKIVPKAFSIRQLDYPSPPSGVSEGESIPSSSILRPKNGELLQGVLLKKRRKKLQGYVKRYFILNVKYGTLSYFRMNDNKLRGQMPINQSIVSAVGKKNEIIIDSGMEVWDLKALNKRDFDDWIQSFNKLKKNYFDQQEDKQESKLNYSLSLPRYLLPELDSIKTQLIDLQQTGKASGVSQDLNVISNNVTELIQKLTEINRNSVNFETGSMLSSTTFYDAKEYLDASNGGVVQLDDDDDVFEDVESDDVGDDDTSFSSVSTTETKDSSLPVISETETQGDEKFDENDNDTNLYPLPLSPVKRELVVPEWTHPPSSLLSFLRKNVGKDLSSIAMPVDMNEPVTMLQKYAELVEYCDMIHNALQVDDINDASGERVLRIAAFAVSALSSLREKERNVRKPFNPLLGETFELVREDKGIRLVSEKVCHKPPVFAALVESNEWTLTWTLAPSQKFWGKTAEIRNKGTLKLTIKSTGEVFLWSQPTSMLKNIIAGEKYTEPSSSMTIKSSTGTKAVVEFEKGGMFSGRCEGLTIEAFGPDKRKLPYSVIGKWTESLTLKTNSTEKLIWTCGKLVPSAKKRFGFTEFANELIQVTDVEKGQLAPTDSRLRPDMRAYLNTDIDQAEDIKCQLEESQRTRRKELEKEGKPHEPLFFHQVSEDVAPDDGEWIYTKGLDSYWNRRSRQDWEGLIKLW